MRYGNYREGGSYNEGESYGRRMRDSRGRYMEGGSYGRRGVKGTGRGRYRGHETIEEMGARYEEYNEARVNYNEGGSYGAKEDSMEALQAMLQSVEDFMYMLHSEAESEQEIQMIKKTARKISEM